MPSCFEVWMIEGIWNVLPSRIRFAMAGVESRISRAATRPPPSCLHSVVAQTLCKQLGGGRVAAREILLSTPAIANLIREGKTFQIPSIIQTSKQLGMLTLNDALLELVEKKQISPDEAYVKSVEKAGLAASLKAKGHKLTMTV